MKDDNIKLIRRPSGGGAVFLDEGNCMFGVVGDQKDLTIEQFVQILTISINNVFGVNSKATGKNDISVDGHKVAGLAYNRAKNKLLCHVCILVNANTSLLPLYLTPHQKKIESHHIKSMDKRVINLCEYNKEKTRKDLEDELAHTFGNMFIKQSLSNSIIEFETCSYQSFNLNTVYINETDMMGIDVVKKMYENFNSTEYMYGVAPKYNHNIAKKFSWGFIELYLQIDSNVIIDVTVNTDCLDVSIPKHVILLLKNIHLNNIDECIANYKLNSDYKEEIYDVLVWLRNELQT